jgi:hypothetical protein
MEFVRERAFDGRSPVTTVPSRLSVALSRVPGRFEQSTQADISVPILDNGVRNLNGLRPYRRAAADKGHGA